MDGRSSTGDDGNGAAPAEPADGAARVGPFTIADPSRGATATSLGVAGGGLGFSGVPGYAVALVTYQNDFNPSDNFVGLSDGPAATSAEALRWLQTTNLTARLQGATRRVRVTTAGGVLTVSVDGAQVLSRAVPLPASALLGFSAGTGGATNRHAVRNVSITVGSGGTAPASVLTAPPATPGP